MGVREQLGERPDEMRLQDLTLEIPKPKNEEGFDLNKNITEDNVEGLKRELATLRGLGHWGNYTRGVAEFKNLFPECIGEIDFDEKEILDGIKGELEKYRSDHSGRGWSFFIRSVYAFKMLFPDKINELDLSSEDWQRMRGRTLHQHRDKSHHLAMQMRVTSPVDAKDPYSGDLTAEEVKEVLDSKKENEEWQDYIKEAVCFRVLFPKKFNELQFDNEIWSEMRNVFYKQQKSNIMSATFRSAFFLKVLAAKEVKITDQGLELIMSEKESFQQTTPPRPERKELN
ncbi:MAG: hypothetical protein HQ530_01265 [Parcubacteria group bacterium]|nr:hypothetical protein [Parcubacteria group bacterium]